MPFKYKLSVRMALSRVFLFLVALPFLSCGGDATLGPRTDMDALSELVDLVILPSSATLEVNDSLDFRAFGITAAGDSVDVSVTWTSPAGAPVEKKGKALGHLKAKRPGKFDLTARADSAPVADTVEVTVVRAEVAAVLIVPSNPVLDVGQTIQLAAVLRDSNGRELTDRAVEWRSSRESVATVDNTGLVTTLAAGSADIVAESEGVTGRATITVNNIAATVALTGTVLSSTSESDVVNGGRTLIFTATGDEWVATLGGDNPVTTAFLSAITSNRSEATGWNAQVRNNLDHTMLTCSNARQCTLVLPSAAAYDITANEMITATIPAPALSASQTPLVATPSFWVQRTTTTSTAGLLFHSDWSTGTGRTDAVIRDTNKDIPWTTDIPTVLSVESAAGLFSAGFANCMRVFVITDPVGRMSGGFGNVTFQSNVPRVGDDLYWRFYMRHDLSNDEYHPSHETQWAGNHSVESFDRSNDPNIGIKWNDQADGRWDLWFMTKQATGAQNWHLRSELDKFTEYRFEFHAHILSESTYNLHIRIYDASGTLLYDDDDFSDGGRTLADLPTIQGNFREGTSMLSKFSWFKIGNNGSHTWMYNAPYNRTVTPAWRFGGVCVRSDDWCGAYSNGR